MDFPIMTEARDLIIRQLKQMGLQPTGTDTKQVMIDYFNLKHKLIHNRPRQVLMAAGLEGKATALGAGSVLGVIKAKFEAGEDVNPFLSRGVYRLADHDYLLNDWGIHHLHLNDQKKASGDYFNLRSGQLLFVHTTADHVYFIDIRPHNEHYVFAQKDLLRAVRDNWPDLNRNFLVREEEMEISPQFNEKDTVIMRRKGYYFFTQVDKHAYAPGLGSACSGFSMQAGLEMNEFHRHLYKIHCFVQENEDELIRMLDRDPDKSLVSLRVGLIFHDWLFYVCERNSGQYLNLDLQDYQPFYPDIPSVDAEGDEAP